MLTASTQVIVSVPVPVNTAPGKGISSRWRHKHAQHTSQSHLCGLHTQASCLLHGVSDEHDAVRRQEHVHIKARHVGAQQKDQRGSGIQVASSVRVKRIPSGPCSRSDHAVSRGNRVSTRGLHPQSNSRRKGRRTQRRSRIGQEQGNSSTVWH